MLKRHVCIAAIAVSLAIAAGPALACIVQQPLIPEDVKDADVVVIGRISNYGFVRNEEFGRHARFNVHVDEVLKGTPAQKLTVEWKRWMFGEPDVMAPGSYLFALYYSEPKKAGGTPSGSKTPLMMVLNPMCTDGFLFPVTSAEAAKVRRILKP